MFLCTRTQGPIVFCFKFKLSFICNNVTNLEKNLKYYKFAYIKNVLSAKLSRILHERSRIPLAVHSHAPSIRFHRGTKVVWPDFQPMRVQPVFIYLFRKNPVFTSLRLKSPVRVVPPLSNILGGT
jgi:hypothetical protein